MAAREIKTTLALDGEKQFKAGMDDAYRAMKTLGSEMKLNTAEYGKNAQSMEGLTGKQKTLTSMQEQQKKIVESLNKAVEESAAAYGESDKRTDAYRVKLNNAKASLVGIEGQLEQTNVDIENFGKETTTAEKKTIDWKKTLGDLDGALDKSIKGYGKALAAVAALGTAVVAAGKKVFDMTVETGKFADNLITTSMQTGISTKALQEWGYAAQFIDTEVETMTGSMAKMIKQLTLAKEGTGRAAEAFDGMGVEIKDSTGQLRKAEDIFFDAIDALGKVGNETERDAMAMEVFGKSARDLNPLIIAGSQRLRELSEEAHTVGVVMSDETVEAFGTFDDKMNVVNSTIQSVKNSFVTAMLPAMEQIQGVIQDLASKFNDWLRTDGAQALLAKLTEKIAQLAEYLGNNLSSILDGIIGMFETVINVVGWVIDNIDLLKGVVVGLTTTLVALKAAQVAVNIAMAAMAGSHIGLVIAGVGALIGVIAGLSTGLGRAKNGFERVSSSITPFGDSVNALRPQLLDINDLLSATGKSVRGIDTAIKQSEEAITGILATALSENRALRQEELDSIKNYNEQILVLQAEKLQLYRDQQLAELRKLQLEEEALTQEGAAQRLANAQAAYEQSNAITEQAYTAQLAIVENKHKAMNTVGSLAYQTDLDNAKVYYDNSMFENQTYFSQSYAVVANAATEWVAVDESKWASLRSNQNHGSRAFKIALDQMDYDNAEAFLSIVATTKKQGGVLSEETQKTASLMLSAFEALPPYMKDAGTDALRGMVNGLKDEIPALESAADMSADDMVAAIKSALGINSPSTIMKGIGKNVVEGLYGGIDMNKSWLQERLSAWSGDVIGWIKGVFGIKSPSTIMRDVVGKQLVQGLALGITSNADLIDKAMASLVPSAVHSNISMDVTRRFNDVANSTASYRGNSGMVGAIVNGFKDAFQNSDTVIVLNDREFGRAVRKLGMA